MRPRTIRHGLVDSTNERALKALHEGTAQHGDVHVAEGQTSGRGRLGRRWESPLGEGTFVTLIARPGRIPVAGCLTLAGGLAVVDVCRALGLTRAELDWPNDVVVGDAKLAGVLTESRGLDPADPAWVVGVGLNVAQRSFDDALAASRRVTSLALEGLTVDRLAVEAALIDALRARVEATLADPTPVFDDAFRALLQGGRDVRVDVAGEVLTGRFTALTPQRGLCLARVDGRAWVPLAHVRSVELTGPAD
ncbi:MAG: biotin--[acetyl-CoA-carboxylase] ligase [Planctomycetota bacterium]